MPKNMTLKSEGFASNLSGPTADSTIAAHFARHRIPYADQGVPVGLDNFLAYADTFRRRFVPHVEETLVTALKRDADAFTLTLETGERVLAKNVVMAVGVTWFAWTPDVLKSLPADLVSHSYAHREVSQFKGKQVAVIGAGSSAIDLAHLLQADGADVRIVARAETIHYNSVPDGQETAFDRWQSPHTKIGRGWGSYFCAQAPQMFYRLPRHLKDRAIVSHMHPAAGWFMRDEVEGRIPMSLGRTPLEAEAKDGRVELTLASKAGEETLRFDHVIAATGYKPDVERIPFLAPALRNQIACTPNGSPLVSDRFETSVPGLYATGLAAMDMFGPLLRFMVGAEFAAPRLATHFARTFARKDERRAA